MGRILSHASLLAVVLLLQDAHATTGLGGAAMGWPWALPFLGILLSIATGPLLFRKIWHYHYGEDRLRLGAAADLADSPAVLTRHPAFPSFLA